MRVISASPECPPDTADPPANTPCDDNEMCSSSSTCISNGVCYGERDSCACTLGNDAECDDKNPCTRDECATKSGGGTECTHTPAFAGTECRSSKGVCDKAEQCDGVNAACPPDAFEDSSKTCGVAVDLCDVPAVCSGSSAA